MVGDTRKEMFACVVGGNKTAVTTVYGTAFMLGGGIFMTAAHVLKGAKARQSYCLGFGGGTERLQIADIVEVEYVDQYDVAFGSIGEDIPSFVSLPWRLGWLNHLDDVETGGFPHAFDAKAYFIVARAFKGYVVSRRDNYGCPLFQGPAAVYEVSFPAPVGLSGAPLLWEFGGIKSVVGMIVGSGNFEMTVFEEERVEGDTKEWYSVKHGLHLGIALTADCLAAMPSKLLGMTLRQYLERQSLVFRG